MNATSIPKQSLAYDPAAISQLATLSRTDNKAAIEQVAGQFEMLLMNQLMTALRETKFSDEEESSAENTYSGLMDQQLVQSMVARGGMGLTKILAEQIGKLANQDKSQEGVSKNIPNASLNANDSKLGNKDLTKVLSVQADVQKAVNQFQSAQQIPSEIKSANSAQNEIKMANIEVAKTAAMPKELNPNDLSARKMDFVKKLWPHAQEAAEKLGVDPRLIISHAALESGWGMQNIKHANGQDSHNLFGVKATGRANETSVSIMTTEFINGKSIKMMDKFRSYPSYKESLQDYVQLVSGSNRYKAAVGAGDDALHYAKALHKGGYATDPQYVQKLVAVAKSLGV